MRTTADAVATAGPRPPHRVAYGNIDCVRVKREVRPHRPHQKCTGNRRDAAHGWLAVLIENADGGALFAFAAFARFSLDSARTKNPSAKMAVTQKINRAALDIFILLVLFCAPAFGIYCVESQLTHCGSVAEILRSCR